MKYFQFHEFGNVLGKLVVGGSLHCSHLEFPHMRKQQESLSAASVSVLTELSSNLGMDKHYRVLIEYGRCDH